MAKNELSGYELSRNWFDWCFENPDLISPTHTAMYFFIIEHCNRLGWKEKFGLPMEMTKDAIGIKNYRTYSNTLNDLINWGFIKLIQKSKNQYSSCIVAIVLGAKASTKALDKALQKHSQKQCKSIVCIDKQELLTIEPINKEQEESSKPFNFKSELLKLGVSEQVASDWMKVRKAKKAANTETALRGLIKEIGLSKLTANECVTISVERSWQGFKAEWIKKDEKQKENESQYKPIKFD
jgi:hypothetical protein